MYQGSSKRKHGAIAIYGPRKKVHPKMPMLKAVVSRPSYNNASVKFQTHKKLSSELKTLDLSFTAGVTNPYTVDTNPFHVLNLNTGTASVQQISAIQQGTGVSQRIGNKVALKSLRIRMNLVSIGNTFVIPTRGRVMILYDRNPNGSYVAANSILSAYTQANVVQSGTYSDNLNPNFFDRFVVLMDKFITLQSLSAAVETTGPTDPESFKVDEFIKLKDLECVYQGTANPLLIANASVGSLQVLTYGDIGSGSDPWALTGTMRLRFRDV